MSETTAGELRKAIERYGEAMAASAQFSLNDYDPSAIEQRNATSHVYECLAQAEAQRDSLKAQMQEWMEGSAQLQVKLDEAERLLNDLYHRWDTGDYHCCEQHRRDGAHNPDCPQGRAATLLASLSTVTPEDYAAHLRERAAGGGKSVEELREKYDVQPDVPSESKPNAEAAVPPDVQRRRR